MRSRWVKFFCQTVCCFVYRILSLSSGTSAGRGIVFIILLLTLSVRVSAQNTDDKRYTGWAVKTNALEWMLTVPNVSFEADLSNSQYNRMTLGLTAKYNWRTYHKYAPYCAFDLFDIRPEFRYYFRTHTLRASDEKSKFSDFEEWFDYNIAGMKDSGKRTPKDWRAYYFGAYVDYAKYAFKFTPEGIQGSAAGFGVSAGYGIPLYQYKKMAIDLELGASLGFVLSKYDKFAHNSVGSYYYPTEQRDMHFVPFPVVSELRVAFAFRPVSIEKKYRGTDPVKTEYRRVMDNIRINFEASNKDAFDNIQDSEKMKAYAANDSLYTADFAANLEDAVQSSMNMIMNSNLPDDPGKYKKKAEAKVAAYKRELMADFVGKLRKSDVAPGKETDAKSDGKVEKGKKENPDGKVEKGKKENPDGKVEKPEKEKKENVFKNLFKGKAGEGQKQAGEE